MHKMTAVIEQLSINETVLPCTELIVMPQMKFIARGKAKLSVTKVKAEMPQLIGPFSLLPNNTTASFLMTVAGCPPVNNRQSSALTSGENHHASSHRDIRPCRPNSPRLVTKSVGYGSRGYESFPAVPEEQASAECRHLDPPVPSIAPALVTDQEQAYLSRAITLDRKPLPTKSLPRLT